METKAHFSAIFRKIKILKLHLESTPIASKRSQTFLTKRRRNLNFPMLIHIYGVLKQI